MLFVHLLPLKVLHVEDSLTSHPLVRSPEVGGIDPELLKTFCHVS